MDNISSIQRDSQVAPAMVPTIPVENPAGKREVIQAVKALNATEMFGQDNQLLFEKDQLTQRMVVRVVNRKTNEVISQIPPEYVLALAQDLKPKGSQTAL